ncbi:MAG: aldo/keto reductase [Erysipelotrichaceae bacterium]|nr:aldo/keto reductase [Erysipelotrichaceae bacterium]
MKYYQIKDMNVSAIALGCMRIASKSVDEVESLVLKALDLGINYFDHADIYGGGKSEVLFGEVLGKHPELREKMYIQSKCGICNGYYDFSKEHIMASVDQSLERLHTSYLDVLLLHRPDTLMDPKEVAEAFDELYNSGKVKYFGVSNMNPMQIALIQKYTKHPLLFNQIQFNVVNAGIIDNGINVNMDNNRSIDHDGSVLEYCRLNDITIQPWSILQASWEKGCFIDHADYVDLNNTLQELSKKYGISKTALSVAWILRHSAHMQPIAGTTSLNHLEDLCAATTIEMSREDWYRLYLVGRQLP